LAARLYLIVSFDFVDRLPLGQCYGCTLADQTEVIEVDVAVKCHVWNVYAIWIRSTLVLVLVLSSSSSSSLIASSTTAMRFMTTYSDPRTAQVHPLARHDDEDSKHGGHERVEVHPWELLEAVEDTTNKSCMSMRAKMSMTMSIRRKRLDMSDNALPKVMTTMYRPFHTCA